jgi:hypothetical protein
VTSAAIAALPNLSGTNTGNQTISIGGDVTAAGGAGALTATVTKVNGVSLAGLATGLLKNTTGTGVPSIATGADLPPATASTSGAESAAHFNAVEAALINNWSASERAFCASLGLGLPDPEFIEAPAEFFPPAGIPWTAGVAGASGTSGNLSLLMSNTYQKCSRPFIPSISTSKWLVTFLLTIPPSAHGSTEFVGIGVSDDVTFDKGVYVGHFGTAYTGAVDQDPSATHAVLFLGDNAHGSFSGSSFVNPAGLTTYAIVSDGAGNVKLYANHAMIATVSNVYVSVGNGYVMCRTTNGTAPLLLRKFGYCAI